MPGTGLRLSVADNFMAQMDATVLATALATLAHDVGVAGATMSIAAMNQRHPHQRIAICNKASQLTAHLLPCTQKAVHRRPLHWLNHCATAITTIAKQSPRHRGASVAYLPCAASWPRRCTATDTVG